MRSIDKLGIFWIEGHDDDVLTGRLVFDPKNNGTDLELVGWFKNQDRNSNAKVRVHGWIANEMVTLDECYSSGNFRAPGPEEVTYHANSLLVGFHLVDELAFDSAFVTFDDLGTWVGRGGIESNSSDNGFEVSCTTAEIESCAFSKGDISLSMSWEAPGDEIKGFNIKQWPTFKLSYTNRQDFKDIQRDVSRLEALISLCTDSPVVDVDIILQRSDARVVMINGTESSHLQPIEYLASRVNYTPVEERKQRQHHRMLLDYEELGGIDSVGRWMDKSEVFARPLNSLMSTLRARQMFMENKFMNVTYAAEALHRVLIGGGKRMDEHDFNDLIAKCLEVTPAEHHEWLIGKTRFMNEASLPKRLNKLAAHAGAATKDLIGRRSTWAQTVAAVRNELTHLKEGASLANGADLYYMAESVYAVARACMLLEAGVSADILNRKSNEYHMLWYKDRLAATIARVRSGSLIVDE